MRRGKKALDIIMGLVVFGFVFLCYGTLFGRSLGFGPLSESLLRFLNTTAGYYTAMVLAGLTSLYALFVILRALVSRTVVPGVKLPMEKGSVKISEDAVNQVVENTLRTMAPIKSYDVDTKIFRGQTPDVTARLELGVTRGTNVEGLGKEVTGEVARRIEEFSGLTVKDVDVSFYELEEGGERL